MSVIAMASARWPCSNWFIIHGASRLMRVGRISEDMTSSRMPTKKREQPAGELSVHPAQSYLSYVLRFNLRATVNIHPRRGTE